MSAGDDFAFFQPKPCGFYDVVNVHPDRQQRRTKLPDAQCRLPSESHETHPIPLKFTHDVGDLMPLLHLTDWINLYSLVIDSPEGVLGGEVLVYPDNVNAPPSSLLGVHNDVYAIQDYLSYISSLFLYFRGDINVKVLCVGPERTTAENYAYVELGDVAGDTTTTYSNITLPAGITIPNFGTGVAATDVSKQPVLEVCLPLRCNLPMSYTSSFDTSLAGPYTHVDNAVVETNLLLFPLADPPHTLQDLVYRKAGSNFELMVETLPMDRRIYRYRGFLV